jgi:hypothetical protein
MCSGDFNDFRRLPIAVVDHGFESFHSLFFKPLVIHDPSRTTSLFWLPAAPGVAEGDHARSPHPS